MNRLNVYRNNPNDENRQEMVNSRSSFKKSVREFRLDCRKRKTQYLLDNKYKNHLKNIGNYLRMHRNILNLDLYRHKNLEIISKQFTTQIPHFIKLTRML